MPRIPDTSSGASRLSNVSSVATRQLTRTARESRENPAEGESVKTPRRLPHRAPDPRHEQAVERQQRRGETTRVYRARPRPSIFAKLADQARASTSSPFCRARTWRGCGMKGCSYSSDRGLFRQMVRFLPCALDVESAKELLAEHSCLRVSASNSHALLSPSFMIVWPRR